MGVCVPRVGAGHAVHRPRAGHGLLLCHDGTHHLEEQGPRQRRGQPSKICYYTVLAFAFQSWILVLCIFCRCIFLH